MSAGATIKIETIASLHSDDFTDDEIFAIEDVIDMACDEWRDDFTDNARTGMHKLRIIIQEAKSSL